MFFHRAGSSVVTGQGDVLQADPVLGVGCQSF